MSNEIELHERLQEPTAEAAPPDFRELDGLRP